MQRVLPCQQVSVVKLLNRSCKYTPEEIPKDHPRHLNPLTTEDSFSIADASDPSCHDDSGLCFWWNLTAVSAGTARRTCGAVPGATLANLENERVFRFVDERIWCVRTDTFRRSLTQNPDGPATQKVCWRGPSRNHFWCETMTCNRRDSRMHEEWPSNHTTAAGQRQRLVANVNPVSVCCSNSVWERRGDGVLFPRADVN